MLRTLTLAALLAVSTPFAAAQTQGLVNLDEITALFDGEPKVEINLSRMLLRLAANASESSDAETATLLRGLDGITVRIFEQASARGDVSSRINSFARRLETQGWEPAVRIRDGDETVLVHLLPRGNGIGGMLVMVLDASDGTAVFVNLSGNIDPDRIGRIGGSIGVPNLGDVTGQRNRRRR
ncbi:hypothetical protein BH23BAC4_BH23BAC4_17550 [soil metagenome]